MPKYKIEYTRGFIKQAALCVKRGCKMELLDKVVKLLENGEALPKKHRQHKLSGDWDGYWECHIQGDWLLIWKQDDDKLILVMTSTGTHSDLFK